MTIPTQVFKVAETLGNIVDYAGEYKGKHAYSIGNVGRNGQVADTGMPIFLLYDGNSVETVIDGRSFDIIHELKLS